jgi:hypothetical protein
MNFNINEHLPEDFSDSSRVWIYQSDRIFSTEECSEIENMLSSFVNEWKSHGTPVKGYAAVFYAKFIVVMADENATGVSGCSTDSSVRVIKEIEKKYNTNMFDRQTLAFQIKEKIEQLPVSQINYAVSNNFISPETLYFDNTISTKKQLADQWPVSIKKSWLSAKIQ